MPYWTLPVFPLDLASQNMATHTRSPAEYEEEIRNLRERMEAMERSKIALMLSTSNEMDRLREYIKYMTGSEPTANKTSFQHYQFPQPASRSIPNGRTSRFNQLSPSITSIGGAATSAGSAASAGSAESLFDAGYRVYSKSPSLVKSKTGTPPGPQVDDMGWTLDEGDMNGIVIGSFDPMQSGDEDEMNLNMDENGNGLHNFNVMDGLSANLNDITMTPRIQISRSRGVDDDDLDALHLSGHGHGQSGDLKSIDQRSIISSSYKKARVSGRQQRQRRGTDYGNQLGISNAFTTIGNSVMVDAEDMKAAMDLNADIIEEMEAALNQFCELQLFGVVECQCLEPKQLQFIATMNTDDDILYECDNCNESHPTIFKCDLCRMSICSKCEKYIAEMQCLRSVMEPFKYVYDFQQNEPIELERFHSLNFVARTESIDLKPHDFAGIADETSSEQLIGKLIKLRDQIHLKAADRFEYVLDEDLGHITMHKIDPKLCYDILDYLDDVDLCAIITAKMKSTVQLLQIYWQLFPYHMTYEPQTAKWKKRRVLCTSNWKNGQLITIRDAIASNKIITRYIKDQYIPSLATEPIMKPELLYSEESIHIERGPNDEDICGSPYFVSKELNEGFGNKVMRLLRIIVDNEVDRNSEIIFERLKHRLYGQNNEVVAEGVYFVWHCHGLERSFAVEQLDYASFENAIRGDRTPREEMQVLIGNGLQYGSEHHHDQSDTDGDYLYRQNVHIVSNDNHIDDPLTPMCAPTPNVKSAKISHESHSSNQSRKSQKMFRFSNVLYATPVQDF